MGIGIPHISFKKRANTDQQPLIGNESIQYLDPLERLVRIRASAEGRQGLGGNSGALNRHARVLERRSGGAEKTDCLFDRE